jgi:DHA1 family multidrug resistance protein-like MFS transporter
MISPIASGWIASNPHLGWRWTEYTTLIISAVAWVVALLFLSETYLPVLLDWKARQLRRVTGDKRYVSDHSTGSLFQRVKGILPLPIIFFSTEPVISVLGAYLTLLYSIMFTFLSGFDYIFQQLYDLSTGQTGSCFGAIAVGSTIATFAAPALYAWTRRKTKFEHGATVPPEFRLWPAIITSPLLPIALFWLGWTNYQTISIWSGLFACGIFGIVLMSIYISSYEYIIDSYGEHAASALASITMVRYIVAGGMVMASRPMYEGIGVHWTMTILGCLSVLLAPMPLVFKSYGAQLRERSQYADSPVGMPN